MGWPLATLTSIWLAARVLLALPTVREPWHWAATLLDLSFTPLVAVAIARPIFAARSSRNVGFVVVLAGLFVANLLMHLGAWGVIRDGLMVGWKLGLDLILLVIVIVTGRVVPMFTRNATKKMGSARYPSWSGPASPPCCLSSRATCCLPLAR